MPSVPSYASTKTESIRISTYFNSVHSITFQPTGKKTLFVPPFPSEFFLFHTPLPLGISMTFPEGYRCFLEPRITGSGFLFSRETWLSSCSCGTSTCKSRCLADSGLTRISKSCHLSCMKSTHTTQCFFINIDVVHSVLSVSARAFHKVSRYKNISVFFVPFNNIICNLIFF